MQGLPVVLGFACSLVLGLLAYRYRTLSKSGVAAALVIAALLLLGGWQSYLLMLAFFSSSSVLTLLGYREKESRGAAEKRGGRDWRQVFCSGGVPALFSSTLYFVHSPPGIHDSLILALASTIAFANADTWAVELGSLSRRRPRLVTKPWIRVPHGVSGGVTLRGECAALLGSALIGGLAALLLESSKNSSLPPWSGANISPLTLAFLVFLIGWLGEVVDSILGALLQAKYLCPACGVLSDYEVHSCGSTTLHVSGFKWVKNEVVNLMVEGIVAVASILIALHL